MVDVQAIGKDGRLRRVRKIAPMQTRRAAEKLEHQTRAELMQVDERTITTAPEAPRFAAFAESVRSAIIRRAVSEGVIGTPKNGRTREVPLCKQAPSSARTMAPC